MKKSYQELYFKYKSKYLKLKKSLGGSSISSTRSSFISDDSSFISDISSFISQDSSFASDDFFNIIISFLTENNELFDISSLKNESITENGNTYNGIKIILNDETLSNVMYFFYNEQLPNNLDLRINQTNYSNLYTDYDEIDDLISLSLYDFDNEKYKQFNILNLYLLGLLDEINKYLQQNTNLQQFNFLINTFKESKINDYEGYKIILRRNNDNKDFVLNFFYKPVLSFKLGNNNIEPFLNLNNSVEDILGEVALKIKYTINNLN